MLLYNKMELGDLNANFTLEVESQVKIHFYLSEFVLCFLPDLHLSHVVSHLYVFAFGLVLKVFDWSYFTAKIMDTVNISVPDTEKVINYSPNYYRRLNVILARYNKRSVCITFVVVFVYNRPVCGGRSVLHTLKTAAAPLLIYHSFVCKRVREFLSSLLTETCRTTWCGVLL